MPRSKAKELDMSDEQLKKMEAEFFMSRDWVQDVFEKRASNTSNAFVFVTMDKVRWGEIRKIAWHLEFRDGRPFYEWNIIDDKLVKYIPKINDEGKLVGVDVKEYVFYADMERGTVGLREAPAENEVYLQTVQLSPEVKWKVLHNMMRREKTTVIVSAYGLAGMQKEVRDVILNHMVASVSKDDRVFANRSTLMLVVPSQEYLNDKIRQLSVVVNPPLSTPEERRMQMIKVLRGMRKKSLASATTDAERQKVEKRFRKLFSQITEEIINASAGLTLDEVESAMLLSLRKYGEIKVDTFKQYKMDILKKVGIEYIEPEYGFEAVGGYRDLKELFGDIVKLIKHPEEARPFGTRIPRGLLLYGLPGTGKTWFANALAKELNLPVIKLSPADFLRGIVGETEARIRQITKIIDSLSPVVVFIDEIDQLAMSRGSMHSTDSGVSLRMISMLLSWLGDESRKAIIVGATNYLDRVDSAFMRSGRIDRVVFVPLPDLEARKEILEIHMFKINGIDTGKVKMDRDILWEVAKRTEYWTGADLRLLCERVKWRVWKENAKEITLNHFIAEMENMGVDAENMRRRVIQMLEIMEKKQEGSNIDLGYIRKVKRQLGLSSEGSSVDETARLNVGKKKKKKEVDIDVTIGDDLGIGF